MVKLCKRQRIENLEKRVEELNEWIILICHHLKVSRVYQPSEKVLHKYKEE
jgi:hypothetical protein